MTYWGRLAAETSAYEEARASFDAEVAAYVPVPADEALAADTRALERAFDSVSWSSTPSQTNPARWERLARYIRRNHAQPD